MKAGSGLRSLTLTPRTARAYGCQVLPPPCWASRTRTVHVPVAALSISTTSTLLIESLVPPVTERPLTNAFPLYVTCPLGDITSRSRSFLSWFEDEEDPG